MRLPASLHQSSHNGRASSYQLSDQMEMTGKSAKVEAHQFFVESAVLSDLSTFNSPLCTDTLAARASSKCPV